MVKMKNVLLIITTLLLSVSIFSQETDSIKKEKSFVLKFAPYNIIDPVNPSLQFGIESKLTKHINIQGEIGYILPIWLNPYREFNPKYNGFKIRGELRHYLNFNRNKLGDFGYYLATELYYTKNSYNSKEYFNKKTDSLVFTPEYSENIRIKKNLFGLNLKIGYQKRYKNVVIDAYVGLGIKYKIIEHFNRSHPEDIITPPRSFYMSDMIAGKMADEKGKYFIINVPINIKIGYVF